MNVDKINKKLKENGFTDFSVRESPEGLVLEGESSNWNDIVNAGFCTAKKFGKIHVINDARYTGDEIPPMRRPELNDKAIDGLYPDVLVIGGGIVGASIARELMKWDLDVLLVEKEYDLALGASGRNDGCVHPGIDLVKGSLKQKYNLAGNRMFDRITIELDVDFDRCGQSVAFDSEKLLPLMHLSKIYFRLMGLGKVRVFNQKQLHAFEPAVREELKCGMFFPTGGIVCPYNLTIAYGENAVDNGAKLSLNTAVLGMEIEGNEIISVNTNRGTVYPKVVVNAAGVFAENIAKMAHDRFYSIHPRKGTNTILDKKTARFVNTSYTLRGGEVKKEGNTKGGGIVRTIDNNVLVGPDAVETYKKEDFTTEDKNIAAVFEKQSKATEKISRGDTITYFSGVRAPTFEEDFIVEKGRKIRNIVHAAGIQSPGITAAPAIALDISKMCVELLSECGEKVLRNSKFNPKRHGIPRVARLSDKERSALISQNPDYGEIVCRCEEISRGEIIDALNRSVPCDTVDGVKKRCRPGMGRCQGGFCGPNVAKIISEQKNIPLENVCKGDDKSGLLFGRSKGGDRND
ncbi:MAG: FAD/NAD(P)-binding oxidoreductase [Firmicutes bacterium HGW-Firmicutes-16]|nr:MAG: FAD/NAD(P)-binding oxidoreductase [Firmicutes bacterium HGW-Firmicutes-16]